MAFFAVIREKSEDSFTIAECHINLWSLGGILGHRVLLGCSPALPFGTRDDAITDLRDRILDQSSGRLIFAGPVRVDGDTIDYGKGPLRLGRVILGDTKRVEARSGKDHSVWTVRFAPALKTGERMYLRLRFAVANPGQIWIWKRSLLARNGALVDIRVSELRETVTVPDWMAFQDHIQARAINPQTQYIRLLEGRVWERYLGRPAEWFDRRRLIIYHWQVAKENESVAPANPFRAFLDLSREFGHVRFGHHVRSAVVMLLLVGLTVYVILPVGPSVGNAVLEFTASQKRTLSIAGVLGTVVPHHPAMTPDTPTSYQ